MLAVHDVAFYHNTEPLFEQVTFAVGPGDRVGLIGPNGSGKSTLLRILAGEIEAQAGQVILTPPTLRIGYLPQGLRRGRDTRVAEVLFPGGNDPARLEAEVAELAEAMAREPERTEFQLAFDQKLARLSQHDGGRLPQILAQLGLEDVERGRAIDSLSGGQRTRLALAAVLAEEPQLLLLDEPTNHLDIVMLEWLEAWLAGFDGGAVIVSHDRTFLDHTVARILDLDAGLRRVREYSGNFSDYLDQFLQEREKQWQGYRDQESEIRRLRQDIARTKEQAQWVERTTTPRQPNVRRLAKKVARKASSREKKLGRYLRSEERLEKPKQGWQLKLGFGEASHLGRQVLTAEGLAVGYADEPALLSGLDLNISAGRRVILTGPNGSGKTTLIKTIAGRLAPRSGSVHLGSSVALGYMSQEQELLDERLTAVATIQAVRPMNETETRTYLHFFLFEGDAAVRPVGALSYGERARLSLARLVAAGCNFLLLDEPINHLDIPSRTQFERALAQLEGTVLAVVHDRYFIDRLATDLWTVADGQIVVKILRQ